MGHPKTLGRQLVCWEFRNSKLTISRKYILIRKFTSTKKSNSLNFLTPSASATTMDSTASLVKTVSQFCLEFQRKVKETISTRTLNSHPRKLLPEESSFEFKSFYCGGIYPRWNLMDPSSASDSGTDCPSSTDCNDWLSRYILHRHSTVARNTFHCLDDVPDLDPFISTPFKLDKFKIFERDQFILTKALKVEASVNWNRRKKLLQQEYSSKYEGALATALDYSDDFTLTSALFMNVIMELTVLKPADNLESSLKRILGYFKEMFPKEFKENEDQLRILQMHYYCTNRDFKFSFLLILLILKQFSSSSTEVNAILNRSPYLRDAFDTFVNFFTATQSDSTKNPAYIPAVKSFASLLREINQGSSGQLLDHLWTNCKFGSESPPSKFWKPVCVTGEVSSQGLSERSQSVMANHSFVDHISGDLLVQLLIALKNVLGYDWTSRHPVITMSIFGIFRVLTEKGVFPLKDFLRVTLDLIPNFMGNSYLYSYLFLVASRHREFQLETNRNIAKEACKLLSEFILTEAEKYLCQNHAVYLHFLLDCLKAALITTSNASFLLAPSPSAIFKNFFKLNQRASNFTSNSHTLGECWGSVFLRFTLIRFEASVDVLTTLQSSMLHKWIYYLCVPGVVSLSVAGHREIGVDSTADLRAFSLPRNSYPAFKQKYACQAMDLLFIFGNPRIFPLPQEFKCFLAAQYLADWLGNEDRGILAGALTLTINMLLQNYSEPDDFRKRNPSANATAYLGLLQDSGEKLYNKLEGPSKPIPLASILMNVHLGIGYFMYCALSVKVMLKEDLIGKLVCMLYKNNPDTLVELYALFRRRNSLIGITIDVPEDPYIWKSFFSESSIEQISRSYHAEQLAILLNPTTMWFLFSALIQANEWYFVEEALYFCNEKLLKNMCNAPTSDRTKNLIPKSGRFFSLDNLLFKASEALVNLINQTKNNPFSIILANRDPIKVLLTTLQARIEGTPGNFDFWNQFEEVFLQICHEEHLKCVGDLRCSFYIREKFLEALLHRLKSSRYSQTDLRNILIEAVVIPGQLVSKLGIPKKA